MEKVFTTVAAGIIASLLVSTSPDSEAQTGKDFIKKYLTDFPSVSVSNSSQKYRMTAVYLNRDLYGNFTAKTKITGDYTRCLSADTCTWNNVLISSSNKYDDQFPEGIRQEYIEDFRYVPSAKMLDTYAFNDFPPNSESVLARNLIWDMMAIEDFAWNYRDSLKLNRIFHIPGADSEFEMGNIGTYANSDIQLCWTGISEFNGKLSALVEFRAIDNKIAMSLDAIKTKGTEQYWGTLWVSLKDMTIEHAEMYGGTIQEIEVTGMENKFLAKTIRELWVDKID
jgi:hypothetical protein